MPVQHLAERHADGGGGRQRHQRGEPGRAVPGQQQRVSSPGCGSTRRRTTPARHVGSLWTSTGTLLATGTFTGETASGWQELDFSSPVAITAGTTYVASYYTSTGHYAATTGGLASAVTNGPLTALAGGGVYAYGSSNAFPSSAYNASTTGSTWCTRLDQGVTSRTEEVKGIRHLGGSRSKRVSG